MSKIRLLPQSEALKIAAGEVIERPAHVVKELLENALDAQATAISLYINDIGKTLIRIVDNGVGMSIDDARMCFLSHATSKIQTIHDLESIATFGFRGEALASIAAISRVTLMTRQRETPVDAMGHMIEYSECSVLQEAAVACPTGTDILVRDLFFNTPVRKKFLKSDETEWNAIQWLFHAFCMSNVGVHFKLYRDGKLVLNAPPVASAKDRAAQLWDYDASQALLPLLEDVQLPFRISGFISNHNMWRYGRQFMHFFVNKRWVKNSELSKGLLKGYLNVLPPERFPIAMIFIDIDASSIDVNVHPKKEEVKFVRPGVVQAALSNLVKKTLEQNLSQTISPMPQKTFITQPQWQSYQVQAPREIDQSVSALFDFDPFPSQPEAFQAPRVEQQPLLEPTPIHEAFAIMGQLFKTYILFEKDNELVMIDQHAAHERVLYEKYQTKFLDQQGTTLLFPETIRLSKQQVHDVMQQRDFFERQGIDLDGLGDESLVIRSAPPQLRGTSLQEFINDAARFINEHEGMDKTLFGQKLNEHLHAQMACKSAVKAGDVLTLAQMHQLIRDLQQTPNRFICVHGRPTTWSMPRSELEKKFKR